MVRNTSFCRSLSFWRDSWLIFKRPISLSFCNICWICSHFIVKTFQHYKPFWVCCELTQARWGASQEGSASALCSVVTLIRYTHSVTNKSPYCLACGHTKYLLILACICELLRFALNLFYFCLWCLHNTNSQRAAFTPEPSAPPEMPCAGMVVPTCSLQ